MFGTAIERETGWSGDEILLTYSIAQFVFAFATIFSGKLVDIKGPRLTITIGGALYGGGLILSSFATSPFMLYLTYGVIVGAGVGFVYVCPIATLVKWFPSRKGMITGLSVAAFGGGSIIFKDVIAFLLKGSDASTAFLHFGLIAGAVIILGAQFTSVPEGFKKGHLKKTEEDFTTLEMVKTSKFYKTWIMYWLAVIPGLLVLGAAKNIGLVSRQPCNVVNSVIQFLHNQLGRIDYEEIHCDTYKRRTRSSWHTDFQGQAQITTNPQRADFAWVR